MFKTMNGAQYAHMRSYQGYARRRRFSELVELTTDPVNVVKKGYSKYVVMHSDDYDLILQGQAGAHIMARIVVTERERAAGAGVDALEPWTTLRLNMA